jgi:hypothetical protein
MRLCMSLMCRTFSEKPGLRARRGHREDAGAGDRHGRAADLEEAAAGKRGLEAAPGGFGRSRHGVLLMLSDALRNRSGRLKPSCATSV